MEMIQRRSPLEFSAEPIKTETRDNWTVALEYEGEGSGPWLVDLSHRRRWDIQDGDLSTCQPFGCSIPEKYNQCGFDNGILINRMNRTQAAIWPLAGEAPPEPTETAYTETTDATLFVAIIGRHTLSIAEKLSALDLGDPANATPVLFQGPLSHVPCQIVVMDRSAENAGILFTCSRGYGRDMQRAVLQAGEEYGLRVAGESVFNRWIARV